MGKYILKNSIAISSEQEVECKTTVITSQKYFDGGAEIEISDEELAKIKKEFGEDFAIEVKKGKEEKEESIPVIEITEDKSALKEEKRSKEK